MNFLLKSMLKSQLKGVPEAEVERIIMLIEKNPELFKKIAAEIQAKTSAGMDQQSAAIEIMKVHEVELKEALK